MILMKDIARGNLERIGRMGKASSWLMIGAVAAVAALAMVPALAFADAAPAAGGAAVILEEGVPLGAFDAPVDPAPWIAALGAIGTALWGLFTVRNRLAMTQRLAAFEHQVLGVASQAEVARIPGVGQTL